MHRRYAVCERKKSDSWNGRAQCTQHLASPRLGNVAEGLAHCAEAFAAAVYRDELSLFEVTRFDCCVSAAAVEWFCGRVLSHQPVTQVVQKSPLARGHHGRTSTGTE